MNSEYDHTYIWCLSLTIALGSLNAGYQIGVLNSLQSLFASLFDMGNIKSYWYLPSTILTITAALSTLLGSVIAKTLGRKKMMHFINLITVIAAFVEQISTFPFLIVGRAIFGVAMGLYLYLSPMFICECSPPQDRGRYASLHQLMIVIGITLGAALALIIPNDDKNGGLSHNNFYRFILFVPAIVAVLQSSLISILFNYDSPKQYYSVGESEKCKEALQRIYTQPDGVNKALDVIKGEHAKDSSSSVSLCLLAKSTSYAVFLGCFISFAQQLTGVNSIMYYSTDILGQIYSDKETPKIGTLLIDGAQIIFTIIATLIVDKLGRKLLLLIGCVGCGVTQLLFGIFYASSKHNNLALAMMVLFIIFFSLSHGPVCWAYLGEIMHPKTLTFAVCVNLLFTILITAVTPKLADREKLQSKASILFYVYAGMMAFSFIMIFIFMKETKGKNSEEVAAMFTKNIDVSESNSKEDTKEEATKEPLNEAKENIL